MHLINGDISGMDSELRSEAIAQALVDESFHILLTLNANRITQERRQLKRLYISGFQLIENMQKQQDTCPEKWQKILVQMATAIVSEIMVSDYLKKMTQTEEVQPFNVLTTEIHRKDESAHNGIFKSLGKEIFWNLTGKQQQYFLKLLLKPASWFTDPEWDAWLAMLEQIKFPRAKKMIEECRDSEQYQSLEINLATLDSLFEELGLDLPPVR